MMNIEPMSTRQVVGEKQPSRAKRNTEDGVISELMNASKSTLVETAKGIVDEKVKESKIFDSTVEDRVPRFHKDELKLGRILGRGGFCMAVAIDKVKIDDTKDKGSSVGSNSFFSIFKRNQENDGSDAESAMQGSQGGRDHTSKRSIYSVSDLTRSNIARLAKKNGRKGGLFVLKQVLPNSLDNFGYLKGLVDLSLEAKFLASLDHPNIIALCGMSSKGPSHFIIIERLQETLTSRLKTWVTIDRQCKGITGAFTGSKRKVIELYDDRIRVALDMARALSYLHEKNIIFRDLKPDNCGFDINDQFKLFDFGLAKELKQQELLGDGTYNLTGMTGAMRYSKYRRLLWSCFDGISQPICAINSL